MNTIERIRNIESKIQIRFSYKALKKFNLSKKINENVKPISKAEVDRTHQWLKENDTKGMN